MPHVTASTPVALLLTPWPVSNTPAFTMLTNAVAPVPTSTERLVGSKAATRGGGGRHSASSRRANENAPASVPACRHLPVGIARALTCGLVRALMLGLQLAPPSVLLNTPPRSVPAYRVAGILGSMARARTP